MRTFFVRESNNSKKDKRSVNTKTKYSIKGLKVQSVAECDNSLNLHIQTGTSRVKMISVRTEGETILYDSNGCGPTYNYATYSLGQSS